MGSITGTKKSRVKGWVRPAQRSPNTGTGRWSPTASVAAPTADVVTGDEGSPAANSSQAAAEPRPTARAPPGIRNGSFTRPK